jgi:hypothetical protein
MFDWFLIRREHRELVAAATDVAKCVWNADQFSASAKHVAQRFGTRALKLRRRLHKPPARPPEFDEDNPVSAFCTWLTVWQTAILEVLFQLRDSAINAVHRIAFGQYDWPQANALGVLCRWSVEGMDRDRTIAPIVRALPRLDAEATAVLAEWLAMRSKSDVRYREIAASLRNVPEFEEAWRELGGQAADELGAAPDPARM